MICYVVILFWSPLKPMYTIRSECSKNSHQFNCIVFLWPWISVLVDNLQFTHWYFGAFFAKCARSFQFGFDSLRRLLLVHVCTVPAVVQIDEITFRQGFPFALIAGRMFPIQFVVLRNHFHCTAFGWVHQRMLRIICGRFASVNG